MHQNRRAAKIKLPSFYIQASTPDTPRGSSRSLNRLDDLQAINTHTTTFISTEQADLSTEYRLDWDRRNVLDLLSVESDKDWLDINRQIVANPSMMKPVPWKPSRIVGSKQTSVTLYEQTILGALCSTKIRSDESDNWMEAAFAALELCPEQVGCSQMVVGHTALWDAVNNPFVPHIFIESMVKACPESVHIVDCDGLTPLDHVLFGMHLTKQTALSGPNRIQYLLKYAPPVSESSPLIRFLSSGYSVNQNPGLHVKPNALLETCKLLLEWNPRLASIKSKTTACSILHIAIRNYGNLPGFIASLINLSHGDAVRELLTHQNCYGDLPIHVACAAGVPTNVLRLILRESMKLQHNAAEVPHPFVWTANGAGYTPVDLEWMRHIESGRDFFSNRGFYPLDPRGVRPYGNAYDSLLRDTVHQIISSEQSCKQGGRRFLLDRIFMIIRYATCTMNRFDERLVDSNKFIVHQACMLVFPSEAFLPNPILELILWLNPDQASSKDHSGRLPLHYAVIDNVRDRVLNQKVENAWYLCVSALLQQNPSAASICDSDQRLPLHLLLDNTIAINNQRGSVAVFDKTLFDLVKSYPRAVETIDPKTGFLPFQASAQNALTSLEATFYLLRRSPGMVRPEKNDIIGHQLLAP